MAATQDDDTAIATAVSITVNDTTVHAPPGQLLIDVCEQAGIHIPRFCYHPRMEPVGMCRMCLVDVDTGRGASLQPSCMVTVADQMVVETESETVKKAQEGVLEFLLLHHPLDCPVCDKGGECPLQDQTMAYGPGESRFVEPKRHFAKPIDISPLVYLDRERCILCDRCTRFAGEVAGDPLIHFIDRASHTQVNTFPDEPFSSYFSGNTVQICPVGALTAQTYRFKARPWDLVEARSTFPNPMGDRIVVEASRDQILRYQGWDSDAVNWGWLSDRDRFSFQACHSPQRLSEPLVRVGGGRVGGGRGEDGDGMRGGDGMDGDLAAAGWSQALDAVADAAQTAKADAGTGAGTASGAQSIAVIGGAHLTCEAQYLWAKLAKSVWGTARVDAQLGDGLPADLLAGLPRATINQACAKGSVVVLVGADLKEELGTLYLRLWAQAKAGNITLIELTPLATGMSQVAAHSLRVLPGDLPQVMAVMLADDPLAFARDQGTPEDGSIGAVPVRDIAAAGETLRKRGGSGGGAGASGGTGVVVVAGRSCLSESEQVTAFGLAQLFEALPHAKLLPALRRGNVFGALAMGLTPDADDADETAGTAETGGNDTRAILTAAAQGDISLLICLGADVLADFPDKQLAQKALSSTPMVVSVETLPNSTSQQHADVVLPAAGFGERNGTHLNLEGRLSPVSKIVNPPGTARSDWMIATELANRCGAGWEFDSPEQIWREIAASVPGFGEVAAADITDAPDGVLVLGAGVSGAGADGRASAGGGADADGSTNADGDTSAGLTKITAPKAVPHSRYTYRLIVHRTLYDNGTLVSNCPSLAGLAAPGAARLNPAVMRELGVQDGDQVTVSSEAAKITAPVKADSRVPPGAVAMAHNHTGADPREIMVPAASATEVSIDVT